MLQLKAATGAGFKIALEGFGFFLVGEGEVVDQFPRVMLGSVGGVAAIVFGEAALEVGGFADIEMGLGFFGGWGALRMYT